MQEWHILAKRQRCKPQSIRRDEHNLVAGQVDSNREESADDAPERCGMLGGTMSTLVEMACLL